MNIMEKWPRNIRKITWVSGEMVYCRINRKFTWISWRNDVEVIGKLHGYQGEMAKK